MPIGSIRSCRRCLNEFRVKRVNQIYCSTSCRRNRKQKLEKRTCDNCDKLFTPKRPWQFYCSETCRLAMKKLIAYKHFCVVCKTKLICPNCGE